MTGGPTTAQMEPNLRPGCPDGRGRLQARPPHIPLLFSPLFSPLFAPLFPLPTAQRGRLQARVVARLQDELHLPRSRQAGRERRLRDRLLHRGFRAPGVKYYSWTRECS